MPNNSRNILHNRNHQAQGKKNYLIEHKRFVHIYIGEIIRWQVLHIVRLTVTCETVRALFEKADFEFMSHLFSHSIQVIVTWIITSTHIWIVFMWE